MPTLGAERHAVGLMANTMQWLLAQDLAKVPGLWGVLTAADTQLTAAQRLLGPVPVIPTEEDR